MRPLMVGTIGSSVPAMTSVGCFNSRSHGKLLQFAAMQRYVGNWSLSGHCRDIVNVSRLTGAVIGVCPHIALNWNAVNGTT